MSLNNSISKCQPPIKLHTLGEESPEDWVFCSVFVSLAKVFPNQNHYNCSDEHSTPED